MSAPSSNYSSPQSFGVTLSLIGCQNYIHCLSLLHRFGRSTSRSPYLYSLKHFASQRVHIDLLPRWQGLLIPSTFVKLLGQWLAPVLSSSSLKYQYVEFKCFASFQMSSRCRHHWIRCLFQVFDCRWWVQYSALSTFNYCFSFGLGYCHHRWRGYSPCWPKNSLLVL